MKHKYRAFQKLKNGTPIMFNVESVGFTSDGVEINGANRKCFRFKRFQ